MTEEQYKELLLRKLGGMPAKRTDGAKILRGWPRYMDEKRKFVERYDWTGIKTAIDIGTGIGFLPWLLMEKGIKVEATEIDYELSKPDGTYKKCTDAMGLKVHSMYIFNNKAMNFPGKYDILVANRTMFDKDTLPRGERFNWEFFLKDAFQYVDKIYIKSNHGSKRYPAPEWFQPFLFKTDGNWHIDITKEQWKNIV